MTFFLNKTTLAWVPWQIYNNFSSKPQHSSSTLQLVDRSLLFSTLYLYLIVTSIRIWFLWYDVNLNTLQLQRAWRMAIDPHSEIDDWHFKHINTWGNSFNMLKYGIVYAIVITIITLILHSNNLQLYKWLFALFCFLVEVVYVSIMWLKMRSLYYDNLGIKTEFLYFWILVLIFVIVGVVGALVLESTDGNSKQTDAFWAIIISLFVNCSIVGLTALPRWLVQYKEKKDEMIMERQRKSHELDNMTMSQSGDHDHENLALHDDIVDIERSWTKIIVTQYGYEAFMSHLQRELSIENFLIITEVWCFYGCNRELFIFVFLLFFYFFCFFVFGFCVFRIFGH